MKELHTIRNLYSISQNRYSARNNVKPVNFCCVAAGAKAVYLVGDFNDWQIWTNPMQRQPDGSWTARVELHHGHHRYAFLVDGHPMLDPHASGIPRNEKGERVSLIATS